MEHNEGVVVSGGSLQAGQLAVGRGAAVTVQPGVAGAETLQRIDVLLQLLDRHAAALPEAAALRSTTEVLREEVTRPEPNRVTVRGLLAGLTEAVRGAAPLLTAVEAIKASLVAIL
jgi:hypothetical protein